MDGENLLSKKSVFISYAHKDDTENFVSRLSYSLDMYMNTFWDVKLQAGAWSEQLIEKIKQCDTFLVVMSHSQKDESKWCQKELEIANEESKIIIPIKRFKAHIDDELEKHQFADFTSDFDTGFKELTFLITGQKLTSWEYLYYKTDIDIWKAMGKGLIPAIITKELAEWMVIHHVWPIVQEVLKDDPLIMPNIFSMQDLRYAVAYLNSLDSYRLVNRDKKRWIDRTAMLATSYLSVIHSESDTNHQLVGQNVENILANIKQLIWEIRKAQRDFRSQKYLSDMYEFETASKLRELILLHARRSRYLY